MVGQAGVELQYNKELMGRDGLRRIVVNSRGVEVAEARARAAGGRSARHPHHRPRPAGGGGRGHGGQVGQRGRPRSPRRARSWPTSPRPPSIPTPSPPGIKHRGVGRPPEGPREAADEPAHPGRLRRRARTFKVVNALAALQEHVITPQTRSIARATSPSTTPSSAATRRRARHGGHDPGHRPQLQRLLLQRGHPPGDRAPQPLRAHAGPRRSPRASTCPTSCPGLFQDPEWKMRTQQARWFPAETVSVAIGQAMSVTPDAAPARGGGGGATGASSSRRTS